MDIGNFPQAGDRLFLMHREVIVTKIYVIFQLVKFHYIGQSDEFCIDYHALTPQPDYKNSLDIGKLRGVL